MNIKIEDGIYGKGYVYSLYSLEDFEIYENYLKTIDSNYINKYNPNFYSFKEDFEKYKDKLWSDGNKLYTIIGIEDDDAMSDWYWICENNDDSKDIKYILANDKEFENGLVE